MTQKRPHPVPLRLSSAGLDWLDARRRLFGVTRSDVLRECIAVAAQHPKELDERLRKIGEF